MGRGFFYSHELLNGGSTLQKPQSKYEIIEAYFLRGHYSPAIALKVLTLSFISEKDLRVIVAALQSKVIPIRVMGEGEVQDEKYPVVHAHVIQRDGYLQLTLAFVALMRTYPSVDHTSSYEITWRKHLYDLLALIGVSPEEQVLMDDLFIFPRSCLYRSNLFIVPASSLCYEPSKDGKRRERRQATLPDLMAYLSQHSVEPQNFHPTPEMLTHNMVQ